MDKNNKEMIRDRIAELASEKQYCSKLVSVAIYFMLGFVSIFYMLAIFGLGLDKVINHLFHLILFILLTVLIPSIFSISYGFKLDKIHKKIQNNYDLILGRKEIDHQKWLNIIRNENRR